MGLKIELDGQNINLEPCPFVKVTYSMDGYSSSCNHIEGGKQRCTYGIRQKGPNYTIVSHELPKTCPLISKEDLTGIITID